jgi:hypothetical protein
MPSKDLYEVLLEQIIFVVRRSPDWQGLAADYDAGLPIDPARYRRADVPGFPTDIVACVREWNAVFRVNFFRCRQVLTEISEHALRQIGNAVIMSQDQIDELPKIVKESQVSLLFFLDDDDLFAPETFELLSDTDFSQCEIATFPLVHIGEYVYTFVRSGYPARLIVGEREDIRYPLQTNNYGISSRIALSEHLTHLQDHARGCDYADRRNIGDTYFDIVISGTNKTPCSASTIGGLLSSQQQYRDYIRRYVEGLGRLKIPRELDWMTKPLSETMMLFAEV